MLEVVFEVQYFAILLAKNPKPMTIAPIASVAPTCTGIESPPVATAATTLATIPRVIIADVLFLE